MKITDIMEDTASDTYYRTLATQIINDLFIEIDTNGFSNAFVKESRKGDVYIFNLSYFSNGALSTKIYIHNYTHRLADAGIDKNNNIHVFHDIDSGIPITQSISLKKTLVHEMIHVFDNIRSNGNIKPSSSEYDSGGISGYANSDAELNAYYHEMLHDFEKYLDMFMNADKYNELYNLFLSTPERFISFCLGKLPTEIKNNLSSANLKKFKSRLYRYYDENSSGWFPQIEENNMKLEDLNIDETLEMDIRDLDMVNEAIYDGMIGLMEIAEFMKMANRKQKELFKLYATKNDSKSAWGLVSDVIGIDIPLDKVTNDSKK